MSVFGNAFFSLLLGLWLACTTAWASNGKPQNESDRNSTAGRHEETSRNEDGFCGLETAQRCAEKLQTAWLETDATRQLEALPFASIAEVKAGLDSLDLKTRVLALTPTNREFVRRKLGDGAVGIAWMQPAKRGIYREFDIGHFAMLEHLEPIGDVTLLDAASAQVFKRSLETDTEIPLLLVGTLPLHDSHGEIATRFIKNFLTSPWLIGALAMAFAVQLVHASHLRTHWKAILLSCLALLFSVAFVLSRSTNVSTAASQSDPPAQPQPDSSIVFERARYDLGVLTKGSDQPRSLTILNKSNAPVQLSEIRTSCSCVSGSPHPSLIPPNGSVEIKLKFFTFHDGANEYQIRATSVDQQAAECQIQFTGLSPVVVFPREHLVGSVSYTRYDGENWSIPLEFVHQDGKPVYGVKIGDIEANEPLLVDVETNHPAADFALTVRLNDQVRRSGFVFQEVPLEISLGAETVTASLKVGADFVE